MAAKSPLQYALYLLGRRARSVGELREKLHARDYAPEDILAAITFLEKNNLIDDAQFAHAYAQDKVRIYRRGRHRIAMELIRKGVDKEIVQAATKLINASDELEAAQSLLKGRERSWQKLTDRQRFERSVALLQRRGFSGSVIREALRGE